jgi:hypothetical protein
MRAAYFLFLFIPTICFSQEEKSVWSVMNSTDNREGELFVYWGYNRAYYGTSDIHYKGDDFDFTLFDARAMDMPEKFDPEVYFSPDKITIPQFNFRVGYYFNKNTAFSVGWDHMKYRLVRNQKLYMSGYIDPVYSPSNELTSGPVDGYIEYNPEFMDFHHSDGFNFARVAIEQRLPIWMSKNGKHHFVMNGSASVGMMFPWTDWTFFGTHYRNKVHLAGYGISLSAGARFEFFKYFFFQGMLQAGMANMTDIMLQDDKKSSRGEQKIEFMERSWSLGGYIPINAKDKKKAQTN